MVKVLFSNNVEIRYKNSTPFMWVFLIIVLDIQWSGLLKTISLCLEEEEVSSYEEKPAYYRNIFSDCFRYRVSQNLSQPQYNSFFANKGHTFLEHPVCIKSSNCQKHYYDYKQPINAGLWT